LSQSYDTPEEAARGDIPVRYARALAVEISPSGDEAFVVLATNEEPAVEIYNVVCYREGGRWFDGGGISGYGLGWRSLWSETTGRGVDVLSLVDEAPFDAAAVIVRWAGAEHRRPVVGGWFAFTAWDAPWSDDDVPLVVRHVLRDGSERDVQAG
jgi:hypothetical protein